METYRDTHQAINYLIAAGVLNKKTAHLSHVRRMSLMRTQGEGPEFVKFGRNIRYTQSALDEYIKGNSAEAQK